MNYRHIFGLALLVLLLASTTAGADPLKRDILAVEPTSTLIDDTTLPGLLAGKSIMSALRDALDLVRGGIPKAAAPGLNQIDRELRQLLAGTSLVSPLPASYRMGSELWLPVEARRLRVWLDAPNLQLRTSPPLASSQNDNLPALARQTRWLPVGRTARLIEAALPLLFTDQRTRAQRLLQDAVHGVRSRLAFERPQLLHAYYSVEAALAATPHWDEALRSRVRHAAEQLSGDSRYADLGARLQAQADSLTPVFRELLGLALDLRRRLIAEGGKISATLRPE